MDDQLLILDVGSSALKAVVFDRSGAAVAAGSAAIATRGAERSIEQDVGDWWRAARTAIVGLSERQTIGAIALTGSMQNLIALAEDGTPAGPAVLYSDRRLDADEVEALGAQLPADYAARTGNTLDPAHTILKLLRFDRYLPGAAGGERLLFGAKDAVIQRMTGRFVVDPTTATTTGLFNIRQGDWDADLVAASGITAERLPEVLPANAVAGQLGAVAAAELGLRSGIPVYNGAGDGAAATWGAFADRPASAYVYLGTTGWVAATMALEEANPPRDIYTLADPIHADRAILISPFLNAGSALEWLAGVTGLPVEALLE
ncbi:FGGY family carbohydrate kinase, partial [Rhizobiaceae sp. 2RAB30]